MTLPRNARLALYSAHGAGIAGLCLYAAQSFWEVCGPGATPFFETWFYTGLIALGAALCLARAATEPRERPAWLAFGLGLLAWAGAEAWYTLFLDALAEPALPSVSDGLWLAFFPASYVGIGLLMGARSRELRASMWLDGLVGALAISALVTALVLGPIASGPDPRAVAVDTTFVAADVLLMAFVVAGFVACGWRPGGAWTMVAAGLALSAAADAYFLYALATGTAVGSTLVATLWPAGALLVGFAAWRPSPRTAVRVEGWRVVAMPVLFGLVALTLLAVHAVRPLNTAALCLALATLLAALARMAATFRENQRLLEGSRRDALTDALTGLGNRRSLMEDLAQAVTVATPDHPAGLVMFDLDGFKQYNDRFGHPMGDALLARLGHQLRAVVASEGHAYRLGGDEFCVVAAGGPNELHDLALRAQAALSDRGQGFEVGCSYGLVLIPKHAAAVAEALHLADDRLYEHKGDSRRTTVTRQTSDALVQVLRECQPSLNGHLDEVALLAREVGRRFALKPGELDELTRAAQLHDIGKVAVPNAILGKTGPLDEAEWRFMRQHTLVGDRILSAAPALGTVAQLVRASHERFDGGGYPDGLAGDEIPFGARVVAVCDAYHAMTSGRPYREATSSTDAIDELRRCAGAQFDPQVVEVFAAMVEPAAEPVLSADL